MVKGDCLHADGAGDLIACTAHAKGTGLPACINFLKSNTVDGNFCIHIRNVN